MRSATPAIANKARLRAPVTKPRKVRGRRLTFRGQYRSFRDQVLPFLETFPSPRIWFAGCDHPEEVYGVAFLLAQSRVPRFQIYATDLSEMALARMEKGCFSKGVLKTWEVQTGKRQMDSSLYSLKGDKLTVKKSIRDHILGFQHNLATDSSFNEFSAIICSDSQLFSLEPSDRDRVADLFHESLPLTGYLSLADPSLLAGERLQAQFVPVDQHNGLFKKIR